MTCIALTPLRGVLLAAVCAAALATNDATAAVVVPWSQRTTVDSDGDGAVDLVDNAPSVANNQADADMDGIGDAIDPTPINTNPNLGFLVIGMNGSVTPIPAGSTANFDYLMMPTMIYPTTPPGDFGYVDLDFGGNGIYDATYFGPLTTSVNQIAIAANLFIDALWNLNQAGTYTMHAFAYGPGMQSQAVTITGVSVVPEPFSLALLAVGAGALLVRRRLRVVQIQR